MQKLTEQQWLLVKPSLVKADPSPLMGRPRVPHRDILDGVLWILKTGAQWHELPERYPPYQTVHRRYQAWIKNGVLGEILRVLAQDMEKRGGISLEECFIDGTFSSAKRGALVLAKRNAARVPSSWLSAMESLFRSPSTWAVLLHMKSPWWSKRLPADLPERLHYVW